MIPGADQKDRGLWGRECNIAGNDVTQRSAFSRLRLSLLSGSFATLIPGDGGGGGGGGGEGGGTPI